MTDFENDDLNELAEFYITKINLLEAKLDKAREAIKNLIDENVSNREHNSSKSIYNITAEHKARQVLEELDK